MATSSGGSSPAGGWDVRQRCNVPPSDHGAASLRIPSAHTCQVAAAQQEARKEQAAAEAAQREAAAEKKTAEQAQSQASVNCQFTAEYSLRGAHYKGDCKMVSPYQGVSPEPYYTLHRRTPLHTPWDCAPPCRSLRRSRRRARSREQQRQLNSKRPPRTRPQSRRNLRPAFSSKAEFHS